MKKCFYPSYKRVLRLRNGLTQEEIGQETLVSQPSEVVRLIQEAQSQLFEYRVGEDFQLLMWHLFGIQESSEKILGMACGFLFRFQSRYGGDISEIEGSSTHKRISV